MEELVVKIENIIKRENEKLRTELRAEFRQENEKLREEFKQDNAKLREEFKQDNAKLKAELKQDHTKLKRELKSELKSELSQELGLELSEKLSKELLDYMFVFEENYGRKINIMFEEIMRKNERDRNIEEKNLIIEKRVDKNSAFVFNHENRITALEEIKR